MEKIKLSEKDKFHLLARAQFICCDGQFFKPMFWAEDDVTITFRASAFGRKGNAKVSITYKYYDFYLVVVCLFDSMHNCFDFKHLTLEKVFGISQLLQIDEHMNVVGSLHHTFDILLYTPKLNKTCVEDSVEGEGAADGQDSVCPAGVSGDTPLLDENKHSVTSQL